MPKLIPLQHWAERTFDPPPHPDTLRRWCRQGRIHPRPKKIGRTYYLHPDAEHVDNAQSQPRLADRILAETAPT